MAFEAGWDRLDSLTLRFADQKLEREYQEHSLETRRRRQVTAAVGGVAIFLSLAVIAPPLTGLPVVPVSVILVVLGGTNLLAAVLASRARTTMRIGVIGIAIQLTSGALLLWLFLVIDAYLRFAALAVTAQSVFAFGVTRHPFRNAVAISAGHTLDFFAFGALGGLAPGMIVDGFIAGAAMSGACVGTYLAERSERRLYAQGLLVADLHRRVDELFHRYVPAEVADQLIEDPSRAELGGEEVEITVLFADLTGFTSFSERVRPADAVAMLNRTFAVAVPAVLDEGGTIVTFAGDAMMAIFNAPVRQPDHAVRAARAALRLQRETASMADEASWPRFRVGLNTGPALVGNVGSAEMRTFTAIGDTTNLAARLQTFAPPGSVVISKRTRYLLGDLADVRPLGEPELKGKSVPVAVFELVGLRSTAQQAPLG